MLLNHEITLRSYLFQIRGIQRFALLNALLVLSGAEKCLDKVQFYWIGGRNTNSSLRNMAVLTRRG